MSTNKESLQKLILFIKELSSLKENVWFRDELRKLFSTQAIGLRNQSLDSELKIKINLIQQYLNIAFIDLIDYDGFEPKVADELKKDCIEMGRHRKGTANNKIDFLEYCKFAHFQYEQMTNYFLNKLFDGDINNIKRELKGNNEKIKFAEFQSSLSSIAFSFKFNYVKRYFNDKFQFSYICDYASRIRNELSHRSALELKVEDSILEKYKSLFPKNSIDRTTATPEESNIYFEGRFIQFKRSCEFDKVFESLVSFKKMILEGLRESSLKKANEKFNRMIR